jgi:hypothetical protein
MANKGTWTITIGGSDFAGYTDIVTPDDNGGGPNILEIQGYGAAAPVFLNLGNFRLARKFTMTREHDTDTHAHDWFQTAAADWSGVADVVLTHMDYAGVETTYTIDGAKVELSVAQPIGPTTITKLAFTGGVPT